MTTIEESLVDMAVGFIGLLDKFAEVFTEKSRGDIFALLLDNVLTVFFFFCYGRR